MYSFLDIYSIVMNLLSLFMYFRVLERPFPLREDGRLNFPRYMLQIVPIVLFQIGFVISMLFFGG